MRNAAGQVVFIDRAEVELTPVAFELYWIAEQIRLHGLPCPHYSAEAQDLYWEALDAGGGPDYEADDWVLSPETVALNFETAAEMADYEGI